MRNLIAAAVACGLLVLTAAGCGGSSSEENTTASTPTSTPAPAQTQNAGGASTVGGPTGDTQADQAIADASVLTLKDFPSGWAASPSDDDNGTLDCAGYEDLKDKAIAHATSQDFENETTNEQVTNTVGVFADESAPSQIIDLWSDPEFIDCLSGKVEDLVKDNADGKAEIGDVKTSMLRITDQGDESAGLRVSIPMSIQGIDLNAVMDASVVRVGRAATILSTVGVQGPMSDSDRDHLTDVASKRLAAALNN